MEAKSFTDILQATQQKIETGEPLEIHLDKEGFLSVVENMLSAVPLPKGVKGIKLLKNPEPAVEIQNREGKGNIRSDPEKIGEHNVVEELKQQPLHQYLQKAIQTQLDQQSVNIDLESVELQFTEDDKLALVIKGKKLDK